MDRNNLNYLVYVHTNKINGKKYVGQSSNIVERWRNGGKNYFSSIKFFRAIQKYGWENFTHEILLFCFGKSVIMIIYYCEHINI